MLLDIFNFLAICITESLPSRYKVSAAQAVASAAFDRPRGLPPNFPRDRAACNPAFPRLQKSELLPSLANAENES